MEEEMQLKYVPRMLALGALLIGGLTTAAWADSTVYVIDANEPTKQDSPVPVQVNDLICVVYNKDAVGPIVGVADKPQDGHLTWFAKRVTLPDDFKNYNVEACYKAQKPGVVAVHYIWCHRQEERRDL